LIYKTKRESDTDFQLKQAKKDFWNTVKSSDDGNYAFKI